MAEQSQTAREFRQRTRREECISNARFLVTADTGITTVLLAFILLLVAPACRRGSSSPTGPSVGLKWCHGLSLGTMRATIDGTTWTPVRVSANSSGNTLELIASDCTYQLVVFLGPVKGPGTYTVAAGDISIATLGIDGQGPEAWTANPTQGGSGSVTLTVFTKPTSLEDIRQASVSGTFSFALVPINTTGTKAITNGSFDSGFAAFSP